MQRGIRKALITICLLLSIVNGMGTNLVLAAEKKDAKWESVSSADWMGQISDECLLSEINIPGTHDTTTQYANLFYFSKTQNSSTKEQLNMGYRYLDIRLECDGDEMKLVHGFVDCKNGWSLFSGTMHLDTVLEECYSFLEEHPTETIVFCVKKDHGKQSDGEFQKLLHTYIEKNPNAWYLKNENPKLSDVRGKIVLARRYVDENQLGDENGGLELFWENQNNKEPADCAYTKGQVTEDLQLAVQDRFCYEIEEKWNAVQDGIRNAPNKDCAKNMIFINFLSTKGKRTFGHPWKYAKAINANYLATELSSGESYGWVIVDYGTEEIARHIYETNFIN